MLLFSILEVMYDSPPNVHRFILDTLEGPANGEKWDVGSMPHIYH